MGDSRVSLTHHFLIAMPSMADPHFANTLIYVCEHNDQGALGIVVNKPIDMTLSALFEQINIPLGDSELREARVHYGGPVQIDRGFVLHRPLGSWQSTLAISDDLGLTTSKDILEAVGHGEGPNDVLVSLGYAGWSAVGENIAAGYATPEDVVAGWMASPGHRANILSPNFSEIGIGVSAGGGQFGTYWTQEFGARPVENCMVDDLVQEDCEVEDREALNDREWNPHQRK